MVSTRVPTSNSPSPFNNLLVTVPKVSITIGIIVTFMFYIYFFIPSQGQVTYPLHMLSVLFCGQPGQQSRKFCKISFFYWFIIIIIKKICEIEEFDV